MLKYPSYRLSIHRVCGKVSHHDLLYGDKDRKAYAEQVFASYCDDEDVQFVALRALLSPTSSTTLKVFRR